MKFKPKVRHSMICLICGGRFKNLGRHMTVHNGSPTSTCMSCVIGFPEPDLLSRHLLTHSLSSCTICDKILYFQLDDSYHVRQHAGAFSLQFHSGGRAMTCYKCTKGFKDKERLESHLSTHKFNQTRSEYLASRQDHHNRRIHSTLTNPSDNKGRATRECNLANLYESSLGREYDTSRRYQCSFCHKNFELQSSLTQHYATHRGEVLFGCSHCSEGFLTETDLKSHQTEKHSAAETCSSFLLSNRKPLKWNHCHYCHRRFHTKRGLAVHRRLKHKIRNAYRCSLCSVSFITEIELRSHEKEKHLLTHDLAPPTLSEGKDLISHNQDSFRCSFCTASFITETDLRSHEKEEHISDDDYSPSTLSEDESSGSLQCENCPRKFHTKRGLAVHKRHVHSVAGLEIGSHNQDSFRCSFCTASFITETDLRSHEKEKHILDNENFPPIHSEDESNCSLQCNYCPRRFYTKRGLAVHKSHTHKLDMTPGSRTSPDNQDLVLSDNMKDTKELPYPQDPYKPYSCAYCESTFRMELSLVVHMRKVHLPKNLTESMPHLATPAKSYPCRICHRHFDSPKGRNLHMVKAHRLERKKIDVDPDYEVTCSTQQDAFHTRTEVQHTRPSALAHSDKYSCRSCRRWFSTHKGLLLHQRWRHKGFQNKGLANAGRSMVFSSPLFANNPEEDAGCSSAGVSNVNPDDPASSNNETVKPHRLPHTCKVCQKSFNLAGTLSLHMKNVHSLLRRIVCPICGAKFNKKRVFGQHLKKHYMAPSPSILSVSADGRFVCQWCGQRFRKNFLYKKHLKIHLWDKNTAKEATTCMLQRNQSSETGKSTKNMFVCCFCEKELDSFRAYELHLMNEHVSGIFASKQDYKCPDCGECFGTVGSFTRHLRSHLHENAIDDSFLNASEENPNANVKPEELAFCAKGEGNDPQIPVLEEARTPDSKTEGRAAEALEDPFKGSCLDRSRGTPNNQLCNDAEICVDAVLSASAELTAGAKLPAGTELIESAVKDGGAEQLKGLQRPVGAGLGDDADLSNGAELSDGVELSDGAEVSDGAAEDDVDSNNDVFPASFPTKHSVSNVEGVGEVSSTVMLPEKINNVDQEAAEGVMGGKYSDAGLVIEGASSSVGRNEIEQQSSGDPGNVEENVFYKFAMMRAYRDLCGGDDDPGEDDILIVDSDDDDVIVVDDNVNCIPGEEEGKDSPLSIKQRDKVRKGGSCSGKDVVDSSQDQDKIQKDNEPKPGLNVAMLMAYKELAGGAEGEIGLREHRTSERFPNSDKQRKKQSWKRKRKRYPCHLCTRSFYKRKFLNIHLEGHAPAVTEQGKSFDSEKDMDAVNVEHHAEEENQEVGEKSNQLDFTDSIGAIREDASDSGHSALPDMEQSSDSFVSGPAQDNDSGGDGNGVTNETKEQNSCKVCDRNFDKLESLQRHMIVHRITIAKQDPKYDTVPLNNKVIVVPVCKFCKKKFRTVARKVEHEKIHVTAASQNIIFKSQRHNKKYGKQYAASSLLRKHKIQHSLWKTWQRKTLVAKELTTEEHEDKPETRNDEEIMLHSRSKQKILRHKSPRFLCLICGLLYTFVSDLRRHTHNGKSGYGCGFCRKAYMSVKELKTHVQTCHPRDGSIDMFACGQCDKKFDCQRNQKNHEAIHGPENRKRGKAAPGQMKSKNDDLIRAQKRDKHEKSKESVGTDQQKMAPIKSLRYLCMTCGRLFSKICDLQRHTHKDWIGAERGKSRMACGYCRKQITSSSELQNHVRTQHASSDTIRMLPCSDCGLLFDSNASLEKHKRVHRSRGSNMYVCLVCGRLFPFAQRLFEHKCGSGQRVPGKKIRTGCAVCHKGFRLKQDLKWHVRTKHKSTQMNVSQFTCSSCDAPYDSMANLRKHKAKHIQNKRSKPAKKYQRNEPRDIDSSKEMKLNGRVADAKAAKGYSCNLCAKQFKVKARFEVHVALHESSQEPPDSSPPQPDQEVHHCFVCTTCGRLFKSASLLFTHHHERHMTHKVRASHMACALCGLDFVSALELQGHVQTEHDIQKESLRGFPCPQCDLVFNGKENLTKHKAIHKGQTKTGRDNQACTYCDESFKTWRVLRKHLSRKHRIKNLKADNIKPPYYVCMQCGRLFYCIANLFRHGHGSKAKRVEPEKKDYLACSLCQERFVSPEKMKSHSKAKHDRETEAPPQFPCSKCNYVYISKASLRKHMLEHNYTTYTCFFCLRAFRNLAHRRIHMQDCPQKHKQIGLKFRDYSKKTPPKPVDISFVSTINSDSTGKSGTIDLATSPSSTRKDSICVFCGKVFSNRWNRMRHERLHRVANSIPITEANSGSKANKSIEKTGSASCSSRRNTEPGIRPNKSGALKNMEPRRKVGRGGRLYYQCSLCVSTYHRRGMLDRHLNNAHGIETKQKQDEPLKMLQGFRKRTSTMRNNEGHSMSGQIKEHNASYTQGPSGSRDLGIHSRDFVDNKCAKCGKFFLDKELLAYHMKLHAGEEKPPIKTAKTAIAPEAKEGPLSSQTNHSVITIEKNFFVCNLCEKIYTSSEKLEQHLASH